MADFDPLKLTNAGLSIQSQAQAGAALVFTRVSVGDGAAPADVLLAAGLTNERRDADIIAIDAIGLGQAKVRAVVDNKDLLQIIEVRELGLFAMDPVDAQEKLYAYTHAGDGYDTIPIDGGANVAEMVYDLITIIGTAQNVSAALASQVYAAADDLAAFEASTVGTLAALLALQADTVTRQMEGAL